MRLLVVDDEKKLATSLKRGLEADGFAVDVALTGTDGLWMAQEHDYDAIVLDLMLPGVNGYKICEQLRDAGNWTPILILTAKEGDFDETEALDTGADDFLRKPFAHMVLVARLRALLRRQSDRPVVMSAGDLRLDPNQRRCWRGDTELSLRAREFSVLEYLVRNAGTVVSKQDILDHVWNYEYDGDPSLIEVYVRNLRKKIDIPFDRAAIQTIRGSGYRLAEDGG
ncbi:MAG: response regulator transcription factor [Actinomycetota bacterium]|nr:response regulator transcription factor [Actinomycetota bacterium]